jgi:DNA polymerase-3 subunit alpha
MGNPGKLFDLIAKGYKMPALAITDHGNMYGALEFYWCAIQSGIKPILGCEVYVAPKSRFDRNTDKTPGHGSKYNHLTLLAKDFKGYQNLMRIVSLGFTEGFYYKPRVDKDIFMKYGQGLIALSGCLAGEIATALVKEDTKKALRAAIEYRSIFGNDNFYIEVMDNGLKEQKKIIPDLIELSKKTAIPLVATNDCHFLTKEDYEIHDVLLCIGTNKVLSDTKRLHFGSNLFYYRSAEEMVKTFSYIPEAIKSTLQISEKINIKISNAKLLLPQFPIPKEYKSDSEYLEILCCKGFKARYGNAIKPEYEKRLKHELSTINKMGFSSYFLIVSDFINYAKNRNIPVGPGRGSGTGSIVAYALGITDICPIKYGLLFERFLNPDRHSMPDLDIDFADSGRDEVIQYVRQKYGEKKCAQIITFGSMQSKLVIKDVARVMGLTLAESNNIAKLVPQNTSIADAIKISTELNKLVKSNKKIANLLAVSQKLEGLKRHTGVHAAGMVIANEEIINYSPIAKGPKNIVTTQYDGVVLSRLGILKIDFLGLRTLTVIDDSLTLIRKKNPSFTLTNIPLNDKKTYELLNKAKTMGIFQLESKGMRDLIRKLKPDNINDIIALIALYRPGPMGSGMLDDFVNRKNGKIKIVYDHPLQESILQDTYGIVLYQEQVMKMSVELAGFSPEEADNLRKAMSKKIPEVIERQKEKFVSGAKEKGINKKIIEKIFNNILAFAGYGFNKSHSAAYSLISYKTAYLKANYPLEYLTALLNSEIGRSTTKRNNEESKLATYIEDVRTFGIKILPPSVQYSDGKFKIEDTNIRFGLFAVKNVGENATRSIEQSRIDGKNIKYFKNWGDFLQRINLKHTSKKALESLIKAGAFDSFGNDKFTVRATLLQNMEVSIDRTTKIKRDMESMQGFLFDSTEIGVDTFFLKETMPLEFHKLLDFEKEVLGFYFSGHPLSNMEGEFAIHSNYRLDKLPHPKENTSFKIAQVIRIVGMITSVKKLISKTRKESYVKFKMEDLYGNVDVVVFPKIFKKFTSYLVPNNIVVVKGKLMGTHEQPEIIAEDITTIREAKKKSQNYGEVHIKISTTRYNDTLSDNLKKIFTKHKGKTKVYLDLEDPVYGNFSIETNYLSDYSNAFRIDVETAIGLKDAVELHYAS